MSTVRRRGLGVRLFAAQLLVASTTIASAWVVAFAIGPSIFHEHLLRVAHTGSTEQTLLHAEQAYREANVLAVGAALVVALLVAVAVSVYLARRVAAPVTLLARAAQEVADGHYDVDLPRDGVGPEFDLLATSFSAMASRLDGVETTRRRLLGDLAHELRTPVATLDAYLEGIEDGVARLDPATSAMLREQTRRLARLADDVAAVSREEERDLVLRLVAPRVMVDAAVHAAADRFAAAGVELRAETASGTPHVVVDTDRLGQVLGNLLDNALRHTGSGGRVVVRCGPSPAGDGQVRLEVVDTGSGISVEHLPHVFERFYRVDSARDRAQGGAGIGLAIVRAVVQAHGGRVAAASPGPGGGATFMVDLPGARAGAR